ncbi:MAG: ROK family protein [Ktedonobacteraceae bacterium]
MNTDRNVGSFAASAESRQSDFVIAIDFGGTKIDVATANRVGELLEQSRIETDAAQGAQQAIERALTLARSLMARTAALTGGRCLAAGVVSPGVILPDRILLAPNVPGWEQLALTDIVRDRLEISRIAVGTDVKAAAVAEVRWGSLQDADPGIFLSLGTGIALAIVIGGKVLMGAHGTAGEIGYSLRSVADEKGIADGHAPLEEAVGGRAIGERGSKLLGGKLSAAEVFASADAHARAFIDETLAELAVHVANLAILLDPARIAIGGGLMNAGERILDALAPRLRFAVPFPPEVVPAHFVHDGALRGAVALALTVASGTPTAPTAGQSNQMGQ